MPKKRRAKAEFAAMVQDRLHRVDHVRLRPMFGGYGIYGGRYFFGLIWQETLFFFTDASTRKKYKRAGMGPFLFSERQTESNYFAVPDTVLDDPAKLAKWAEEAIACRVQFEQSARR